MLGLCWTTMVLHYILPCMINCCFLCSLMFNGNSTVDWITKPENTKNRISVNNVPCLLMFASCVNKDAAEQIKYDPMDKLVEGGEVEENVKDIEN